MYGRCRGLFQPWRLDDTRAKFPHDFELSSLSGIVGYAFNRVLTSLMWTNLDLLIGLAVQRELEKARDGDK